VNRKSWECRDGRIWLGNRCLSPEEVAYRACGLEAEAERLAEELLVARGEVARLRGHLSRCRELLLAFIVEGRIDHKEASEVFDSTCWSPAAVLAPPAREGGAA
jgi:hypothetical protein